MLESIEKLRKLRDEVEAHDVDNPFWVCHKATIIADEIEREITEKYMLLPVDADGVPIRYGDKLSSDEMPGRTFTCFTCLGFSVTQLNGVPWWTVEWRYDGESGTSEYVSAKSCRHVKTRTVEDVLRDVWEEALDYAKSDMWRNPDEVFVERADEIRELLGGDAE